MPVGRLAGASLRVDGMRPSPGVMTVLLGIWKTVASSSTDMMLKAMEGLMAVPCKG